MISGKRPPDGTSVTTHRLLAMASLDQAPITPTSTTSTNPDTTKTQQIVVHIIGDAFVDLIVFLKAGWPDLGGDATMASPLQCVPGGSGLNTGTHLARLTQDKAWNDRGISSLVHIQPILHTLFNATDDHGRILQKHADDCQLAIRNGYGRRTSTTNTATGHCLVIVSQEERSFMTYTGCMADFSVAHLDEASLLTVTPCAMHSNERQHIHVSGYWNLYGFWNGNLLNLVQQMQPTTVRSIVTQHDATGAWDGGMHELLYHFHFVFLNELEAQSWANRVTGSSHESYVRVLSNLCSQACFVVTRGPKGATVFQNHTMLESLNQTIPVTVMDPTGAGDAFAAGFIQGLWQQVSQENLTEQVPPIHNKWPRSVLREALLRGCATGTAAVQVRGASVPLNPQVIDSIYQQQLLLVDTQDNVSPSSTGSLSGP